MFCHCKEMKGTWLQCSDGKCTSYCSIQGKHWNSLGQFSCITQSNTPSPKECLRIYFLSKFTFNYQSFLHNTLPIVDCLGRTLTYSLITRLSTIVLCIHYVKCWKIKQNQLRSLTEESWWGWILKQTPFFVKHLMKSSEP